MLGALLFGTLTGVLFSRFRLKQLLLLAFHLPYRFWLPYDILYEAAETQFTYKMLGESSGKSQKDFLRQHRELQPHALSHFKSVWNAFAWQTIRDYACAILVSLTLFWSNYMAFVIPYILIQAGYFAYLYFYKQYRLDFFAILMIGMLLRHDTK